MYTTEFERIISGHSSEKSVPLGDYPVNSVIGVLPSQTDAMQAIRTLRSNGFLQSEIHPLAGDAAADALHDHAGHGRLLDAVLRVAERWDIVDEEIELKASWRQRFAKEAFSCSSRRRPQCGGSLRRACFNVRVHRAFTSWGDSRSPMFPSGASWSTIGEPHDATNENSARRAGARYRHRDLRVALGEAA